METFPELRTRQHIAEVIVFGVNPFVGLYAHVAEMHSSGGWKRPPWRCAV